MDHAIGKMDQNCQAPPGRKVFGSLLDELTKILDMIVPVVPVIESACPGGTAGIRELCLLNNEIEKTKLLLLHLAESSCFYLAMTREAVILRCERRRNALHESLSRLVVMLPDSSAHKVSEILFKLGSAKFGIDPEVEVAGRGIFSILKQACTEEAEFKVFADAARKLDITSPRARLVEKRSIKKLISQLRGADPQKEAALKFLLYLFRKYEKRLLSENPGKLVAEKREKIASEAEQPESGSKNNPSSDSPPKVFICPLSSELMRDPVVIASGETYERSAIANWFQMGHDVCPKTGKKMMNFSMVPNSCMKALISSWCEERGIRVSLPPVPSPPRGLEAPHSFTSLNSCSIASFGTISATNVRYRITDFDVSNISVLSSESFVEPPDPAENDKTGRQYSNFFSELAVMGTESRSKVLAELESLTQNEQDQKSMLADDFLDELDQFLGGSRSKNVGLKILSFLFEESRLEAVEVYRIILSLINSESDVVQELAMEILCKGRTKKDVVAEVCSAAGGLVGNSLKLLHKLSGMEEWPAAIVEVKGCVAAVAEALDLGNREEQADAAGILLELCSIGPENRVMVMREGVIPALVHISLNGSSEGQTSAMKLLHLLRDVRDEDQELSVVSFSVPNTALEATEKSPVGPRKRGFFGRMFRSKPWSLALF